MPKARKKLDRLTRLLLCTGALIVSAIAIVGSALASKDESPSKRQSTEHPPALSPMDRAMEAGNAPSRGSRVARARLVVFTDFDCPFCEDAATMLQRLGRAFPDDLHIVIKQYPLRGTLPAEAALAAGAQGRFWEMHDRLFFRARRLDRDSILAQARALKLNMSRFVADLDGNHFRTQVEQESQQARDLGLTGVPSFVLNGRAMTGPQTYDSIRTQIETILGPKRP